jgi:hypothetical protein
VGALTMSKGDKAVSTVPIETQAEVERGRWFHVMADRIRLLFGGLGHILTAPLRWLASLVHWPRRS